MGFLRFTLKDLLDILVVWAVTYQVLKFFRGTRASYMLFGILVLILVALIAQIFNLLALSWIMGTLKTIGLVALIIVFQPEIRRALIVLGRNPTWQRIFQTGAEGGQVPLEEIVDAVFFLRDRGLGAILVIEGQMLLQEYVEETGTVLDAQVSSRLLLTLFLPQSPLHDGAVILRGDRVVAAGVLLPLSANPALDPELGTRHRAAIGITEVSDAIAIVVSEERRVIRIAYQGSLTEPLAREDLESRLAILLGGGVALPQEEAA